MNNNLEIILKQYSDLGFDTLPLISNSKKPYSSAWQTRLPERLWQDAPQDANIGIRGGGLAHVAFIDCDEPKAFEHVTNHLAGIGYCRDSYPVVQTANNGWHIYLTLAGTLPGAARNLSKDVGLGEFRYGSGAFVVAPPSYISGGHGYKLLSGDFKIRPELAAKDILPILGNREIESKPKLSRKALALLHGKGISNYSSRSEAEQSLIASLINAGLSFSDVLDLFNRYPCAGKYAELKAKSPKGADYWLSHSYNEAMQWGQNHESKGRRTARLAIEWAESTVWQGKTGAIDRLVYLAHANIAYRAGRLNYAAACRDLAEMAGIGFKTASRSTQRLCKSGLLVIDRKAVANSSNTYCLGNFDKVAHSLRTSTVRKCVTLSNHDIFRYGGLGKSAYEIYTALQANPASTKELEGITGRSTRTIKRVLERMQNIVCRQTGEYLPMVTLNEDKKYYLLTSDFTQIAHVIGTFGKGEKQKQEHEKDRRLHAVGLERGRNKQNLTS